MCDFSNVYPSGYEASVINSSDSVDDADSLRFMTQQFFVSIFSSGRVFHASVGTRCRAVRRGQ